MILDAASELMSTLATGLALQGIEHRPVNDLADTLIESAVSCELFSVWQAGPCIVGLNIVQPWWSPDPVLAEELIVRYKPGDFADTINELEAYAKAQGCTSLVISSLAQVRKESYGHYLERKGFTEVARQYMKGIT